MTACYRSIYQYFALGRDTWGVSPANTHQPSPPPVPQSSLLGPASSSDESQHRSPPRPSYGSPGSNVSDSSLYPSSKAGTMSGSESPLHRALVQSLFFPLPGSSEAEEAGMAWDASSSPRARSFFARMCSGDSEEGGSDLGSSPVKDVLGGRDGAGAPIELTPAAYGLAASMCSAQGLQESPPQVGPFGGAIKGVGELAKGKRVCLYKGSGGNRTACFTSEYLVAPSLS